MTLTTAPPSEVPLTQLANRMWSSQQRQANPYRAATHNKGIMNGIDAVVIATPDFSHGRILTAALATGIYAGALTCTPALAAAIDTLNRILPESAPLASVGYGIAYPYSMISMVLLIQFLPKLLKRPIKTEEKLWLAEKALEPTPIALKRDLDLAIAEILQLKRDMRTFQRELREKEKEARAAREAQAAAEEDAKKAKIAAKAAEVAAQDEAKRAKAAVKAAEAAAQDEAKKAKAAVKAAEAAPQNEAKKAKAAAAAVKELAKQVKADNKTVKATTDAATKTKSKDI